MRRALYFGCLGGPGHYLHLDAHRRTLDPREAGLPWDIGLMDAGLLRNRKVPDVPDGRVHWTCARGPWFAFFWWDRSVDHRGASNSGFYVSGFDFGEAGPALEFAVAAWPEVAARQLHPLTLTDPPPTASAPAT